MTQDIMYPTNSDILPEWYEENLKRILSILSDEAEYSLVLVSKPHREVWEKLAKELVNFRKKIIVRFTIGSQDNDLLKLLEPGAPSFEERLKCLKIMHRNGYRTSVSMEPAIDLLNIEALIKTVLPYVTTDIWIGTMNHVAEVIRWNKGKPKVQEALAEIIRNQMPSPKTLALLKRVQALSPMILFKQGACLGGQPDFRKQLGLPPGTHGVKEWGANKISFNLLQGCYHNCAYCYSKHNRIRKSNTPKVLKEKWITEGIWCKPVLLKTQPSCFRQEQ